MTKLSLLALALGAASAAVAPRSDDHGAIVDSSSYKLAGGVAIVNQCKRNLYIRHPASDKTITLLPSKTMQDMTRADKGDKTYTYKIGINENFEADKGGEDDDQRPDRTAVFGFTYKKIMTGSEAGADAHLYSIIQNPLPGQNVSISIASSAAGPGSAAAAAAAGVNRISAHAAVPIPGIGASSLALAVVLCTDRGGDPDKPKQDANFVSPVGHEPISKKTFSDRGITSVREWQA